MTDKIQHVESLKAQKVELQKLLTEGKNLIRKLNKAIFLAERQRQRR